MVSHHQIMKPKLMVLPFKLYLLFLIMNKQLNKWIIVIDSSSFLLSFLDSRILSLTTADMDGELVLNFRYIMLIHPFKLEVPTSMLIYNSILQSTLIDKQYFYVYHLETQVLSKMVSSETLVSDLERLKNY